MTDLRKWILPAGMVAVTALVALHGAFIPGPPADRKPAPAAKECVMESVPPECLPDGRGTSGPRHRAPEAGNARPAAPFFHFPVRTAYPDLASAVGDIDAPPDEETGESLRGNRSWFEWILNMEKSFGRDMDRAAKRKMLSHHLQALYLQDTVQREYFSGIIDWEEAMAAVKDLLAWDDAAYREILTEEQYGKLTALKKNPPDDVGDGLWRPSGEGEVFYLFPNLREQDPPIKTEEDLYEQVSREKVRTLTGLLKENFRRRQNLEEEMEAEEMTVEEYFAALEEDEKTLLRKARKLLAPEEFNLFFPEVSAG
ncbi:MAG TPA: hypothetical protein PLE04_00210 [Syntrophales bacterium]|nr:hypothetical protein [Syntrophales bacterium]HQN77575.1 hypothetical protein [Syntrophales bacterium]